MSALTVSKVDYQQAGIITGSFEPNRDSHPVETWLGEQSKDSGEGKEGCQSVPTQQKEASTAMQVD